MSVTRIPKRVTLIEPKKSFIVNKEQHHQKRVAAYCRVSTDSEEQLTSYQNQMRVYTEMIAANTEWEFAGLYADEGITGTLAEKRPRFQAMIDDCLNGKIDYIITKSVSRFARNVVECIEYVRILKARGIGILFEEQSIDTLKADSEMYLIIYAAFAQSESESMSKNITWAFRKNFEEGKVYMMYKKTLGYRKGANGEPEIVPEEAVYVDRIYSMYLAGATLEQISETIRAESPTFPNKTLSFSKTMILRVLQNEKYCGDCILQKTVTLDPILKKRKANDGEAPMWYVEGSHPAIISRETFNRVQEEMARRKTITPKSKKNTFTSTGKYSKYALTDVLICGECGTRYRRCTWTGHGKRRIVWRCVNRLDYGKKYCKDSLTVDEHLIQQAIVRALNQFNKQDEAMYLALMRSTIADAIGLTSSNDDISLLERRIDALNKRILETVSASVQSGGDITNAEDEIKELSEQIGQLKSRIRAIQESTIDDETLQARTQKIQATIDERFGHSDEYDDSIVRQMVECVKVYADGRITVIFGGGVEIEEHV